MSCRVYFAVLVLLIASSRAFAWWDTGHAYITHNAVQHLPAGLEAFVTRNLATIDFYAHTEPPGQHYIDIDLYPEFHAGQMPRDLNVLYATYGTTYVNSNGIAPWVIANYRATLAAQMRAAVNQSDFEVVARTAGELAHYLEDINNPLHTTDNHNGQYTGNNGIHGRYEGEMIERHMDDLPIEASTAVYVSDTVDWVLDSIETRSWAYVDDIMEADTLARTFGPTNSNAYYNSLWNSTGPFTHTQFQYATEMVASAWYSAWIDAGSPALGVYGDYNGDDLVNAADYVAWRKGDNSQASYELWRRTFGAATVPSGGGGLAAVPEPNTIWLLAVAVVCVFVNTRNRASWQIAGCSGLRCLVAGCPFRIRSGDAAAAKPIDLQLASLPIRTRYLVRGRRLRFLDRGPQY
jgi:hypothetical protein